MFLVLNGLKCFFRVSLFIKMNKSLNKNFDLYKALKRFYGFDTFKGRQEQIIRDVLDGKNVFVIMPTGGGKSLTFQLPALLKEGVGIVISPLIALMKNQVDMLRASSGDPSIAHFMNSSLNRAEIDQVKEDLVNQKTKLLYVAPESLTREETVEFLRTLKISLFAVDEAHCISEWGHDFRPEYRRIRPIIDNIGQVVPIMALTATATVKVQTDIQKNMSILDAVVYKDSFDRENLYYEVRPKTTNVIKDIIKYIKNNPSKSGIVYCLSRKKVEEVAELIQVNGIKALPYHAGLDPKTRKNNQDDFLMERVDVIVATIAFGMGIDKPDIRFVIHHDMPKSIESYYQETGRGGRDGGEGNCIAFYRYEDIAKLEKFSKDKSVSEKEIAKQLLLEMVAYAESSVCRHHQLLHYFGEKYTKEECGACDNCNHPRDKFEGMGYLKLLLEAMIDSQQQLKAKGLTHFMVGKSTSDIKAYKLHRMELFGVGQEEDEKFWNAVIRQAMIYRLIDKSIENYGVLVILEAGMKYIEHPYSIMLTKDHDYENPTEEDFFAMGNSGKSGSADEILMLILKDIRRKLANDENIPPYVIFQDNSLNEMTIQYPITEEELLQVSGVGVGKAKKYGKPFLDVIKKYVEENEIVRPVDMVIKSPIKNSISKIFIIQNIDRKLPLDELAAAQQVSLEELLYEISKIVLSGMKIDINYYIEDTIEDWHQDEIWDYFLESETDDLEEAFEELVDEEITEDEVRMMRIKFLSEYGN